ncbi:MAG: MgtC/SapB family protein [Firmicutes bacterium]|nr:MgtC/SapB family protein [Bacillota bacterium]
MEQIQALYNYIGEFHLISIVIRAFCAVIAGGIIGSERGRHGSAAGFRTHILVCLGGAMTALISLFANTVYGGMEGDILRMSASVVSGIGFLGAGIILVRNNNTIAGLTTAAGMWVTATIGVAFGFGFYFGGLLATVICVVNAALLTKLEHKRLREKHFYVEINNIDRIPDILDQIENVLKEDVFIGPVPAKSGIVGNVGFEVTTSNSNNYAEMRQALNQIEGVCYVVSG